MKNSPFRQGLATYYKLVPGVFRRLGLLLALDVVGAVLAMLPPLLAILVFDFAIPQQSLNWLLVAVGAGLLVYLANFFVTAWGDIENARLDFELTTQLAVRGFSKLEETSLSKIHQLRVGDLTERLIQASDVITGLLINLPSRSAMAVLQLLLFFTVSFWLDPAVTWLGIAAIPFYFLETRYFGKKLQSEESHVRDRESDLYEGLQEKLHNLKSIKTFGCEEKEKGKLKDLFLRWGEGQLQQKVTGIYQAFASSLILQLWTALVTAYLAYEVIVGKLTVGEMITLGIYLPLVQQPIQDLAALWTQTRVGAVSLERFELFDTLPTERPVSSAGAEVPETVFSSPISCRSLDFSFQRFPVLKGFEAQIPAKKLTALVGPSGIGKSTVAHLLLGLYPADAGQILFGDRDIRQIPLTQLRRQVGVLFQESPLFAGTIRDNITFGTDAATEEAVVQAAQLAQAADFIAELPQGYQTLLQWGGSNLSAGQRQRVALARTLLHQPKILILDEPSAALDAQSEFHLGEVLESLRSRMTILLLSHSLSSVKQADQILFLDHGRVLEQGSFEELMGQKGAFFDLYHIQMGGFQEFHRRLEIELERHRRYEQDLSLVLLKVSETESSEILKLVRHHLRVMDFCSQYLKDEIVIGLPETGEAAARFAAKRLMGLLEKNHFRFQLGLAWTEPKEAIYSEALFNAAELSLKRGGRV